MAWIIPVVVAAVAVVGAVVYALANALSDADKNFSDKPVSSPTHGCSGAANCPSYVSDGADIINKSDKYKNCADDVKKDIVSKDFTADEKKMMDEALGKMAPLMKCDNQPVKKIGKTGKAISKNKDGCYSETSTMGEWFEDSGALVMTDAAANPVDFPDKETQFKGTAVHELAHGLLGKFDPCTCTSYTSNDDNPVMKDFRKIAGWDATGTTLTETDKNKAPTGYAKTNSQEDLSECMMLYIYDPEKLKKASQARYDYCKKLMECKK